MEANLTCAVCDTVPTHINILIKRKLVQIQMHTRIYIYSGDVRPHEVLALMGPSGSGKTTLLSVLGGRPAKALSVTGASEWGSCMQEARGPPVRFGALRWQQQHAHTGPHTSR